jgi:large subunit ribosomal protein L10
MIRADKQKMVDGLKAEFVQARTGFLMTYQGLTVAQVTELRRKVRAAASRLKVVKNRLAARAAQDTPLATLARHFKGPVALAYNQGEPVALAKALLEFAKENPQLAFRAGVTEARALDAAAFEVLATLPSREALLARLLGLLRSPQRRLVGVLAGPLRNLAAVLRQVEAKKG